MTDIEKALYFAKRKTLNPYMKGFGAVFKRLYWDLNYKSHISRSRLKSLVNSRNSDKAVILCNGPSLLKVDFSALKGTFTFGLNKINLLFDKTDFKPSCIVAVNPLVLQQNASFYNTTDIPLFLDSYAVKFIKNRRNISYLHNSNYLGFARDCSISISQGFTVTYVALQLAFHMGFKEVALVGCDHNFSVAGQTNLTVVAEGCDESHFDPNYFAHGTKWQLPDLFESEVSYVRAKNVYQAFGRNIFNSTEGGKLEVFDRLSLSDFLMR